MSDLEDRPTKIRKIGSPEESVEATPGNSIEVPVTEHKQQVLEESLDPATTTISEDKEQEDNLTENLRRPRYNVQLDFPPGTSKSQRKKLTKKAEWEAGKDYRKAKRREQAKAKKERKREAKAEFQSKIQNGEIEPPKPALRFNPSRPVQVPLTLILDCDFDEYMVEKEIISLGSQITRCHSDNRKNGYRSHLCISSWGGRMRERFEGVLTNNHLGWTGVRFMEEDFEKVGGIMDEFMRGKEGGVIAGALAKTEDVVNSSTEDSSETANRDDPYAERSEPREQATSKPKLVYLSSDSPHTLERLSPNTSYIIGGIVDKNRHKGLCYKRACDRGIPTAKLPIGEFMTMQSRTVLTVNHVVEIMLKWLETGDWGEAFLKVIPKRKEAKLKTNRSESEIKEEDESDGEQDLDTISGDERATGEKIAADETKVVGDIPVDDTNIVTEQ
jgi:tRNA (guanine9-N1)-methyltransferase